MTLIPCRGYQRVCHTAYCVFSRTNPLTEADWHEQMTLRPKVSTRVGIGQKNQLENSEESIIDQNNDMRFPRLIRASVLLACLVAHRVTAQDYTLANLNSSLGINAVNGGFGPAGITSWTVDGVNQLKFQTFYYRIGTGQEFSLDNITSTPVVNASGGHVDITYANASFSLKLTYDLFGNPVGSQNSGLGYSVQILNNQASALDFHLFQYSDYDLGGTAGSDSVVLQKIAGRYKLAGQTDGAMWMTNQFSMTAVPTPTTLVQAGMFNGTLFSLTDSGQTVLSDTAAAGAGNTTYAVQWDLSINPSSSASLSGSFTMAVPEPCSVSMFIIALFGLAKASVGKKLMPQQQ